MDSGSLSDTARRGCKSCSQSFCTIRPPAADGDRAGWCSVFALDSIPFLSLRYAVLECEHAFVIVCYVAGQVCTVGTVGKSLGCFVRFLFLSTRHPESRV